MKLFILSAIVIKPSTAAVVDPCWFVGLRFGKTASQCVDGLCQGLRFATEQMFIPRTFEENRDDVMGIDVSCEQAHAEMSAYLESVNEPLAESRPWRKATGLPTDIKQAMDELIENVMPAIWSILYQGRNLDETTLLTMGRFDRLLLLHLKGNPNWPSIRSLIVDSGEIRRILKVWNYLVEWTAGNPSSVSSIGANVIHFVFDIISVIGPVEGLDISGYTSLTTTLTVGSQPVRHRPPHPQELSTDYDMGFEGNPEVALTIARHMSNLAEDPTNHDAARTVLSFVTSLPSHLGHHPSSATYMLVRQLHFEVCPRLLRIIQAQHFEREQTQMGVGLIYHCRDSSVLSQRIGASLFLGELEADVSNREPIRTDSSRMTLNLMEKNFSWLARIDNSRVSSALVVKYIAIHFLSIYKPFLEQNDAMIFKPRNKFKSPEFFEVVMRGLGRLLGLCARYHADCNFTPGFRPILLSAVLGPVSSSSLITELRAPQRLVRDLDHIREYLIEYIHEPVFFIRLGLRDVLGSAGVHTITSTRSFGVTSGRIGFSWSLRYSQC
jgi:hypothetical protein